MAPTAATAQPSAAFEQGMVMKASDLLPGDTLHGSSYRVRDQVVTDGFMAHFEMDSDFGTFTATGVPQLRKCMVEVEAIRKLVETSKSDLFAEGLKRSIEQPIDAVKNIVSNPAESAKQVPKTVGHFFGKIGSSIERGANKVADRTSGKGPTPTAGEVGSEAGSTAKNVAGFDKAKLDTAKQLGVDPYSDNPRLQEEINKVTWAFFAGGLPLRIAASVASAGMAVAVTNMAGIPEDTYALTQSELALRDQQALEAMNVRNKDIKKFMIHPQLSTTRRHCIVKALMSMPKAKGREDVIRLANECRTVDEAYFLINALDILAKRQRNGETDCASMKVIGRLPAAVTSEGELLVPAPVDYVTWTEDVAKFAHRDDLGNAPKVLAHTGKLSQATTTGLTESGWKIISVEW